MQLFNRFKSWLEWKGISVKDLLVMGGCLAVLVFVAGLMTYGMLMSVITID